jgi:hypothetical protein
VASLKQSFDSRQYPYRPFVGDGKIEGPSTSHQQYEARVPRLDRRTTATAWTQWAQVIERGYEGLMAKDEASLYVAEPTKRRLKVKVLGWTVSDDPRRRGMSQKAARRSPGRRGPLPRPASPPAHQSRGCGADRRADIHQW